MAKHFIVQVLGHPEHVVKAKGEASARRYIADHFVTVREATPEDLMQAGKDGVQVQDATVETKAA